MKEKLAKLFPVLFLISDAIGYYLFYFIFYSNFKIPLLFYIFPIFIFLGGYVIGFLFLKLVDIVRDGKVSNSFSIILMSFPILVIIAYLITYISFIDSCLQGREYMWVFNGFFSLLFATPGILQVTFYPFISLLKELLSSK